MAKRLHWVSLGELSKAIELMQREGVKRAVMAGQVKHSINLQRDTTGLEAGQAALFVAEKEYGFVDRRGGKKFLRKKCVQLVDSTIFLKPLLPDAGVLTKRAPNEQEAADIEYGLGVAREIAANGYRADGGDFQTGRAWRLRRWRARTKRLSARHGSRMENRWWW